MNYEDEEFPEFIDDEWRTIDEDGLATLKQIFAIPIDDYERLAEVVESDNDSA